MVKICVDCEKEFEPDEEEEFLDFCPACSEKKMKELWDWYLESR